MREGTLVATVFLGDEVVGGEHPERVAQHRVAADRLRETRREVELTLHEFEPLKLNLAATEIESAEYLIVG